MESTTSVDQPLLELKGIGKDFGAVRALQDVDLKIYPGEVVGVMGDNGAGKSTLVKIVAGNFPASHGEIRFEGKLVHFRHPIDAREVGIEIVYQDLALADNLTAPPMSISAASSSGGSVPSLSSITKRWRTARWRFLASCAPRRGRSNSSSRCRAASARPSPSRARDLRTPRL